MARGEGQPVPPVRSEILGVLGRLDPFRDDPEPLVVGLAELSPQDHELLATATKAELRLAARDAVRTLANSGGLVRMGDATLAPPHTSDWSYLWPLDPDAAARRPARGGWRSGSSSPPP
jgi:hypothetical protein